MEEIVQEYGKVIVGVILAIIILGVIAFSWKSIGDFMVYFNETIAGGNRWNNL